MKFTSIFFAASAAIFLTCHKKVRNFSEINTLHGAIFLLYIFISPTNGLSLNLFNAHKSHKSTRIIYALRLCCHPDGSLNSKH